MDDLDEFHDIVAAQNVGTEESVAEALLERLHQRFPRSAPLANAAKVAHHRAQAPAPLNVGPLLVAVLVVGVFVAAVIGASLITKPYVPKFRRTQQPSADLPRIHHRTYAAATVGAGTSADAAIHERWGATFWNTAGLESRCRVIYH